MSQKLKEITISKKGGGSKGEIILIDKKSVGTIHIKGKARSYTGGKKKIEIKKDNSKETKKQITLTKKK